MPVSDRNRDALIRELLYIREMDCDDSTAEIELKRSAAHLYFLKSLSNAELWSEAKKWAEPETLEDTLK